MKRGISIFLLSLIALSFFSVLSAQVVSAAPETGEIVSGVKEFFQPILEAIFGESSNIFEQLLFTLLIIAFVYMALDRVPIISDNTFALWTATIATAILAVRFIATENLVELLLMPQGVLGVALLTIIPFVIYFWFVEFGLAGSGSRVLRKLAWVVYGAVWAVLWYKQAYGDSSLNIPSQWAYLYLIAALAALALLLFDGTIQRAIAKSKKETHLEAIKERRVSRIKKQMFDAERDLEGETLTNTLSELDKKLKEALK
jgi:ABC-type cobalt transport system substrate-binding protein